MKKLLNKKGFTLIELIVVIAIIAILAAILIPSLLNYIQEANDARDLANARSLVTQEALARATESGTTVGDFPAECSIIGDAYPGLNFQVNCNGQIAP